MPALFALMKSISSRRRETACLVILATSAACFQPEPHVFVTVDDPNSLATAATRLSIGLSVEDFRDVRLAGRPFPLTVTLVGEANSAAQGIWVEARGADGAPLARGYTTAIFRAAKTNRVTVVLAAACHAGFPDGSTCVIAADTATFGICVGGGCDASRCGDGYRDIALGEECDDANDDNTDACVLTCKDAICGDSVVETDVEACDDGNTQSGDGCRNDCKKVELCGDAELDAGEQCDDGNLNPNDGCFVADRQTDARACTPVKWSPTVISGHGGSNSFSSLLHWCNGAMASDRHGGVYIADGDSSSTVRRLDMTTGVITRIAGGSSDVVGESALGDGGPAATALFTSITDLEVDSLGNLYIADAAASRVRMMDARTGIVKTVAGTGVMEAAGDDGPATGARLAWPTAIATDGLGNLYIADSPAYRIRRVDGATGIITTAIWVSAYVQYLDIDDVTGNLIYAEGRDIVAMTPDGLTRTVLYTADYDPTGVVTDTVGNVYVLLPEIDGDTSADQIIRIAAETSEVEVVAGTLGGAEADGIPAIDAALHYTVAMVVDTDGSIVLVDDTTSKIRRIDSAGIITTIAGGDSSNKLGKGQPARTLAFGIRGATIDATDNVVVTDSNINAIRRVDRLTGLVSILVGNGMSGHSADGTPAVDASLYHPGKTVFDTYGNLLFTNYDASDTRLADIEYVDFAAQPPTLRTLLVGTEATDSSPRGLAIDHRGYVYMTVDETRVIRAYACDGRGSPWPDRHWPCRGSGLSGDAYTLVGQAGTTGFSGDGGPALAAELDSPDALAVDALDNVYIADRKNCRVRRVSGIGGSGTTYEDTNGDGAIDDSQPDGVIDENDLIMGTIDTIVGNGMQSASGACGYANDPGGDPLAFGIGQPSGLAFAADGSLYIAAMGWEDDAEYVKTKIFRLSEGTLTVVLVDRAAWERTDGDMPEGFVAEQTWLTTGEDFALDSHGNFLIGGRLIVDAVSHAVTSIGGNLEDPSGDGPLAISALGTPGALVLDSAMNWALIADGASGRVRRFDFADDKLETVVGTRNRFVDSKQPSALAKFSRYLQNPKGLVYLADRGYALISEAAGNTLRKLTMPDPGNSATWTIATYAGALPRQICCLPNTSWCSDEALASLDCTDDSMGHVDGARAEARFNSPMGMVYEPADPTLGAVVYLADSGNHVVRRIDVDTDTITTVAGIPQARGFIDGDGSVAMFNGPEALALGPSLSRANGSLYIADTSNHAVRRLDLDTHEVETIIGDGVPSTSGIGAPARYFPVAWPRGLTVDRFGNLFISSGQAVRVIYAGDDDVALPDDEVSTLFGASPRDTYPSSVIGCITGLALDPTADDDATLYMLDMCNGFVVRLDRDRL